MGRPEAWRVYGAGVGFTKQGGGDLMLDKIFIKVDELLVRMLWIRAYTALDVPDIDRAEAADRAIELYQERVADGRI